MTLTIGLNATTLLAIWLLFMGGQQITSYGYPRWLVIVLGVIAVLAAILFLIGR